MLSASITHDLVAVDEALREPERLGDAAGLLLVGVLRRSRPNSLAVAEQAEELAGVVAAGDEHHVRRCPAATSDSIG